MAADVHAPQAELLDRNPSKVHKDFAAYITAETGVKVSARTVMLVRILAKGFREDPANAEAREMRKAELLAVRQAREAVRQQFASRTASADADDDDDDDDDDEASARPVGRPRGSGARASVPAPAPDEDEDGDDDDDDDEVTPLASRPAELPEDDDEAKPATPAKSRSRAAKPAAGKPAGKGAVAPY